MPRHEPRGVRAGVKGQYRKLFGQPEARGLAPSAVSRYLSVTARKSQGFQAGVFKEWTGIFREYAIPPLEFLDRERVTHREGDELPLL